MGKGIGEMVQWVEVLAANKPNDLSSIPGPHTVERENRFPEVVQRTIPFLRKPFIVKCSMETKFCECNSVSHSFSLFYVLSAISLTRTI